MKIGLLIVALAITGVSALAKDISIENTLTIPCTFTFRTGQGEKGKSLSSHIVESGAASTVALTKEATHVEAYCKNPSNKNVKREVSIRDKKKIKVQGHCELVIASYGSDQLKQECSKVKLAAE